ncbi:aminotransferase class V-fold PLP-dependent enzyme [Algoriphagus zhangzhouensis]|uniref:Selenocysteine lyase/Cysteine desulfurase n=1 Tax=Algoriphagus zhangzhouensis TaxID=1073327 RepID=A0A1M7ZB71_9BACT|nr:aminotransferase class V-fold PLP-dependent enzyme [Algoriphagus zhangzhouensis]TDY46904.1 selenocysteine lyase/cysteine desulfurase [Algoriphagus zhangzhouensis]SHO62137.1 Selenocysteine lyase/Cysteine desulfurase [Algoriphagus zhangzhouensis]
MFQWLFKKTISKTSSEILYEDLFSKLRQIEYNRLDDQGHVYLDYTGGGLYSQSQLDKHFKALSKNIFGNPHSTNPTSTYSTILVQEARNKVLEFFRAKNYYCIFTQNASMALKIVGECYPFEEKGKFLLLADNHNSVNGIREYCNSKGGVTSYIPINIEDLRIPEKKLQEELEKSDAKNKLFAYPAQSNVSGVKHSLDWIDKAQQHGWDVLLDAAAFVPTNPLDLSIFQPEFVSISFYKIFGFPTGIGCLLVKKSAFEKLHKKWFAGGTVSLASANAPYHFLAENHERYENGTLNYLDIPAINLGLRHMESIGMDRLKNRIESLSCYLFDRLESLKHSNGVKQVEIFGPKSRENCGGNMIISFRNPDQSKIGFEKIEKMANSKKISIRSGCFCNPGLDETNNCITSEELVNYFTSRKSGDYWDMIDSLKKMRGATRVSVGIATIQKDLDSFISFVEEMKDQNIKQ